MKPNIEEKEGKNVQSDNEDKLDKKRDPEVDVEKEDTETKETDEKEGNKKEDEKDMDSIVEEATDDEELKLKKGENEPVTFDFENEIMVKLDSEKYIKNNVDEENQQKPEKEIDIVVEEGKADGSVKLNKGEKKSVTFDLDNDEEDVKDNQIKVQVDIAITTLNIIMESLEKIAGKMDNDYIFLPSSQKDLCRYSVVTEDITDDKKDGKK